MFQLLLLLVLICGPSAAATQAEELMLAGRITEALPVARSEATAKPSDIEAQERYIDLLLLVNLPSVAEKHYRARLVAHPEDPDAHYLVGRSVTTALDAKDAYEKALRLDPKHARSHMGIAAVHRAGGSLDDAQAAYERALSLDSSLAEAWAGLGATHLMLGDAGAALQTARKGIEAVPDNADGYLAIAVLAPDEAKTVLQQAARNAPKDPRGHASLAEVLLSEGDGSGALKSAQRALALSPNDPQARLAEMFAVEMNRGNIDGDGYTGLIDAQNLEDDAPDKAMEAYGTLVKSYPKSALPYMSRARAHAMLGRPDRSRTDLEKALELDPKNVEAQAAYGLLLMNIGEAGLAKKHLSKAHDARPEDASLAMALAMSAAGTGDVSTAKKVLKQAVADHPYDDRVAMTYARVLSDAGELDAAYAVLADAVERIPDPRLVLALAAAAKDAGRPGEAARLLEELGRQTGNRSLPGDRRAPPVGIRGRRTRLEGAWLATANGPTSSGARVPRTPLAASCSPS